MKRVRGTVAVADYFRINMCIRRIQTKVFLPTSQKTLLYVVTEIFPCLILFYTKKFKIPASARVIRNLTLLSL